MQSLTVGGHKIAISHPDKLMYPDDGITKAQVVNYYLKVSQKMLPLIEGRPVVLQRWPDGIKQEGFYQKEAGDYFPGWIKTVTVDLVKGGKQHLVRVDSAAALAYLANQGALTFHIWTSRLPHLKKPDRMVFDLDPSDPDFTKAVKGAQLLRKVLQKRSYKPWVMTTGSRGLHVIAPIVPKRDFAAVRAEAEEVAAEATSEDKSLTLEVRKAKRAGRIYIDIARNGYGQTQVAPYSLRALPSAPIAKPLKWSEVNGSLSPQRYRLPDFGT
jgi:bifunctional non-homologous end joining protein LigD